MIGAGRLDRQVQFLGRPPLPTTIGAARGGFTSVGDPVWAFFKPGNEVRLYFGNFRVYVPSGTLTARTEDVTTITAANQVVIEGQTFQVRGIQAPDRRSGVTAMDIVGAQDTAAYTRELDVNGDVASIRRNGTPPTLYGPVRVLITTYMPEELTGNMQEADRKVLMLAGDVAASGLPLPLQPRQDRMVLGDRAMTIQSVDDTTHSVAGVLIAYELRVSGN